jgi:hypothetical protein
LEQPQRVFAGIQQLQGMTRSSQELVLLLLMQEYVLEQIRQFAVEFAQQLVPQITQQHLDLAFSRALYALSARSSQQTLKLQLRFMHKCK